MCSVCFTAFVCPGSCRGISQRDIIDVFGLYYFFFFYKTMFQIKASFGINHFQVKYFDEDNEEVRECVYT